MPQVHFDAAGLIAGIHVPGELAPQGEQEVKEEEDEGPLLERKEADDGDALPALRGLGDLARMSSPDHPPPDLPGSQPCSPQSQPESEIQKYRSTEIHLPSVFYTKHTINITWSAPHRHLHSTGQSTASAQECAEDNCHHGLPGPDVRPGTDDGCFRSPR